MPSAGTATAVAPVVPPPARRRRRRRHPVLAALALLVVAAVVGLLLLGGDGAPPAGTTVPVVRGTVTAQVRATGTVVSATAASPAFTVDGTVAAVAASVGAQVRTGDILATLQDDTARARSSAATATLEADQRARQAAAAVLPVPDPVALARLDAAIATDRAGVTEAARALDATVLRAPQDGTVTDVGVRPGDRVTADSPPAVRLVDLATLVVSAGIGPREVTGVVAGQEAVVTPEGGPGLEGRLAEVAPAPGPDGRYGIVVDAALPTTARIGQPVDVTVVLARHTDVLLVPAAAVQAPGTVFVRGPDGTRPRAVTLGITGPEGVEVVDGLVAGQDVVVPGPQRTAS